MCSNRANLELGSVCCCLGDKINTVRVDNIDAMGVSAGALTVGAKIYGELDCCSLFRDGFHLMLCCL